jgi:hypothetical protein
MSRPGFFTSPAEVQQPIPPVVGVDDPLTGQNERGERWNPGRSRAAHSRADGIFGDEHEADTGQPDQDQRLEQTGDLLSEVAGPYSFHVDGCKQRHHQDRDCHGMAVQHGETGRRCSRRS